jgi:hypothetical protein
MYTLMIRVGDNDHPTDPSDKYTPCCTGTQDDCEAAVNRIIQGGRGPNGWQVRWFMLDSEGNEFGHDNLHQAINYCYAA